MIMPEKENPILEKRVFHPSWSACPNCFANLRPKRLEARRPYLKCPFCGAAIAPIAWQRIPWVTLGLLLSFAIPAALGVEGITLLFAALLFWFPANVLAYILVFTAMPPKYVRRDESVRTLFQR
jgi:hypothetical protein